MRTLDEQKTDYMKIYGSTRLSRFGGYVNEEWLSELRGARGIKAFKEMRDNDAVIGAMLFAFKMLLNQLPVGLREHSLQFEQFCLDDIRSQAGNPALTEEEILDMIKPTLTDIAKQALPIVANDALDFIKKHYPAVTASSVLSALISYLVSTVQK